MISRTLWRLSFAMAILLLRTPHFVHADDAATTPVLSEEGQVLAVSREIVREAADYSFRRWLRSRVWDEEDEARYGLAFDENWETAAAAAPELPLVILVHGYNSNPLKNAAVLEPIRAAGYHRASSRSPSSIRSRKSPWSPTQWGGSSPAPVWRATSSTPATSTV